MPACTTCDSTIFFDAHGGRYASCWISILSNFCLRGGDGGRGGHGGCGGRGGDGADGYAGQSGDSYNLNGRHFWNSLRSFHFFNFFNYFTNFIFSNLKRDSLLVQYCCQIFVAFLFLFSKNGGDVGACGHTLISN